MPSPRPTRVPEPRRSSRRRNRRNGTDEPVADRQVELDAARVLDGVGPVERAQPEVRALQRAARRVVARRGEAHHGERMMPEEHQLPRRAAADGVPRGSRASGSHQIAAPYSLIAKSNDRRVARPTRRRRGPIRCRRPRARRQDDVRWRTARASCRCRRRLRHVDPSTPTRSPCHSRARWHVGPRGLPEATAAPCSARPRCPSSVRAGSMPVLPRRPTVERSNPNACGFL